MPAQTIASSEQDKIILRGQGLLSTLHTGPEEQLWFYHEDKNVIVINYGILYYCYPQKMK